MGKSTGSRSAYSHSIKRILGHQYRLSWSFDTKVAGSRLRYERTITRDTDFAGAVRFAKKWDLRAPSPEGDAAAELERKEAARERRAGSDLRRLLAETVAGDQLAVRETLPEEGYKNWFAITRNGALAAVTPVRADAIWMVDQVSRSLNSVPCEPRQSDGGADHSQA